MKRPMQHVMEDQAEQLIRRLLPDEWIIRNIPKDYGVDLEIEMVDQDFVTGNRIWVQSKAVKSLDARFFEYTIERAGLRPADVPDAPDGVYRARYFTYRVAVKELAYALRCTVPLLLFVCDLKQEDILWLPLRDEIVCNIAPSNPHWRDRQTVNVRLPAWNRVRWESANGFPGLHWFALEPARMTAFVILHYYFHEFQYRGRLSGYEIGDGFIDHGEEEELRSSLTLAGDYLESALALDVLFGLQGIDFFTKAVPGSGILPIAVQLKEALRAVDVMSKALDEGKYDFMSMALLLGKVSHALDLLSTAIASYQEFRSRFLFSEGAVAWRASARLNGLDGPPAIPMDRQKNRRA